MKHERNMIDCESIPAPEAPARSANHRFRSLAALYFCTAATSVAATLLNIGVFFYSVEQWKWEARHNLVLAMLLNAFYIGGALLAGRISGRFGRARTVAASAALASGFALTSALLDNPRVIASLLIAYTMLVSQFWPAVASLTSITGPPAGMSRRLGIYNLTWSITFALGVAITGSIIDWAPVLLFVIPGVLHLLVLAVMLLLVHDPPTTAPAAQDLDASATQFQPAADEPNPELLRVRTMALWLSRISLPAAMIMSQSLWAMFPLLPVLRDLAPTIKTLVTSVFVIARVAAFGVLTLTVAWHARPRLLLAASMVMLVAYLGIVVRPSEVFGATTGIPWWTDLTSMIGWQAVAGFSSGLIFSASLYFGMVLSRGSTKHGGYHESLVGLGGVLGPGVAAAAQWIRPGDDLRGGIGAVAGLLAITIVLAGIATLVLGRAPKQFD